MDGNPFGHSITFQEGSSIKLLDYNEDQQIVLREDALNILRRLPEPVAVISLGNVDVLLLLLLRIFEMSNQVNCYCILLQLDPIGEGRAGLQTFYTEDTMDSL